ADEASNSIDDVQYVEKERQAKEKEEEGKEEGKGKEEGRVGDDYIPGYEYGDNQDMIAPLFSHQIIPTPLNPLNNDNGLLTTKRQYLSRDFTEKKMKMEETSEGKSIGKSSKKIGPYQTKKLPKKDLTMQQKKKTRKNITSKTSSKKIISKKKKGSSVSQTKSHSDILSSSTSISTEKGDIDQAIDKCADDSEVIEDEYADLLATLDRMNSFHRSLDKQPHGGIPSVHPPPSSSFLNLLMTSGQSEEALSSDGVSTATKQHNKNQSSGLSYKNTFISSSQAQEVPTSIDYYSDSKDTIHTLWDRLLQSPSLHHASKMKKKGTKERNEEQISDPSFLSGREEIRQRVMKILGEAEERKTKEGTK
ncbi:hypothetical protein ADUPG1_011297, partial [Aduncisulcus paluster]